MRNIFNAAVALVAVIATTPLHAQDVSRAVNLAGLDLRSIEGQNALHARVRAAAKAVCEDSDTQDLAMKVAQTRCRQSATIAAERQVAVAIAHYRATSLAVNAN